ncbi:retrovirus-related Pol polyprotein from transposon 17.6 [Trichonephila clavipes]|nr:retrovirus-related Pol polyprotein from transposon 17.6 [Trichonephila clavipes]
MILIYLTTDGRSPVPKVTKFTCRNCGGGDRGRVAIYRPFGEVSLSLNRTVTCMVLKANDRRTSCPCHDESRGPRSDYVRQGPSESLQEFAARINKLGTQIFQSGNLAQNTAVRNANDQLLQSHFISGLRNDIRRFVLSRDPLNLDESINAALIEEQNMKLNQIASEEGSGLSSAQTENPVLSALADRLEEINKGRPSTGGQFNQGNSFNRRENVFKCFYCGIQGHRQAECRKGRGTRTLPIRNAASDYSVSRHPGFDGRHVHFRESAFRDKYAAPRHLREKWRLVLDFRKLNEITLTQDFVIPTLDDILHEISGSNYFSALDMKSAFNEIPLHFADRHKTAFSTPNGDKYEFNRLCFGLKNSPKAFQSIAQEVLGDLLHNGALVYIDDIILFTKTIDEHFELLGKVFERFERIHLKFNPSKCQFLTKSCKFLGFVVTPEGILIDKDKSVSINEFPVPKDQKQIKSFLGCCNFYRRYIKNFAKRALPLTNLLRKDTPFEWTSETQEAFDDIKKAILNPPVLALPDPKRFTCRNCGGGDRGCVAIYRPFGEVSLSLNRTVTCMVLKANDRRTSCPCHDESRGPRSDYVRQVALATTTTQQV